MARYTGAVPAACAVVKDRKLFLKGERCYSDKCAIVTRRRRCSGPAWPGPQKSFRVWHCSCAQNRRPRRFYGVLEEPVLPNTIEMADRNSRAWLVKTSCVSWKAVWTISFTELAWHLPELKQDSWFVHGHFTVNGKKANIPSILAEGWRCCCC